MKYTIQLCGKSAGAALTRSADAKELRVSFSKAIQQKHLNGRSSTRNEPALFSSLCKTALRTATTH